MDQRTTSGYPQPTYTMLRTLSRDTINDKKGRRRLSGLPEQALPGDYNDSDIFGLQGTAMVLVGENVTSQPP